VRAATRWCSQPFLVRRRADRFRVDRRLRRFGLGFEVRFRVAAAEILAEEFQQLRHLRRA